MSEENQYLNLIKKIIEKGDECESRNGKTLSVFGEMMTFSLKDNIIPLLTTKKLAWKTCFRELMWFINGSTDNKILKNKKVKIWNENGSKTFLKSRGLNYEEDDLGPIYGHQWRHFNAEYKDCNTDYSEKGIDQLENLIKMLKDPSQHNSRRMIISAWNPCQIDEMALPPCHLLMQFSVRRNKYLSCCLYQRSGDVGLGVPFNIASYSFLTHLLAFHCDLEADKFVHFIGDCHIYDVHVDSLKEQINRQPITFPKFKFLNKKDKIEDYSENDIFWIKEYEYQSEIKMKMIP